MKNLTGLEKGRGWNKGLFCEWSKRENNVNWKGGKIEKTCLECGKQMFVWNYLKDKKKYCSRKCSLKNTSLANKEPWNKNIKVNREPWNKGVKTAKKIEKTCINCGCKYFIEKRLSKNNKYCSHSCFTKYRKDNNLFKGNKHFNWGKKLPFITGNKNHNWKGGVSKDNKNRWSDYKYINWRKAVFQRDNYTCQGCKKRGCYLEAHHILPWSLFVDQRYILSNGITYCKPCHAKNDKFRKIGVT